MSGLTPLIDALDLTPTADGFSGTSIDHGGAVVFGGQLLGQVVVAAARTMHPMEVHTLQMVFARGARPDAALTFAVEPTGAGRSFASATVTVLQGDRLCARALVLGHVPDPDLVRYSTAPPPVGSPADLPPRGGEPWWDVRYDASVDIDDPAATGPPTLDVWTRFPDAPDDPVTAQALLAFASDGFLIATAMRPHPGVGQSLAHVAFSTTVLTHSIAFHDRIRADEWMLLAHRSPVAGRGRSYGGADVFTEDGRVVASYSQGNVIRAFPEGREPPANGRAPH
jgi:acyl-CoA thioesterase